MLTGTIIKVSIRSEDDHRNRTSLHVQRDSHVFPVTSMTTEVADGMTNGTMTTY